MAVPEHRRRGFILPEQISGHPVRSICFDIPDVEEYRQAFWGHLWELGNWHVWQKLNNADTRDEQAAAYWREVLSTNYTRWLGEDECAADTCREYPPSAGFIEWFPNNPYLTPDFVGDGYNNPAWYLATTASNIAYGSSPGDAITSLDRFPPGSLPSVIPASGLPRFRINVSGAGTVKAQLVNLFGGSLVQTTTDDDIGTLKFTDVSRDTISVPPETQDELILEFEFTTPGAHHIDFIVISWVNSSIPFLHHGGGLRKVELCGFETMPVVTPPFRFTEGCGLEYYNGEEWLPVDGWTEFAPACFAGEDGEDGEDGANLYLREHLPTGLEQSSEPTFAVPTLIHAYYRADAARRAVAFLAQAILPNLTLYTDEGTQRLRIGSTSTVNEIDSRNNRFDLRGGAGAVNNRRFVLDENGNFYFSNTYAPPGIPGFVTIQSANSSIIGLLLAGRTGSLEPLLQISSQNQADGAAVAPAMRVVGSVSGAINYGTLFEIDKFGKMRNKDSRSVYFTNLNSPQKTSDIGLSEDIQVESPATSADHRSRVVWSTYRNGTKTENLRLDTDAAGLPRWGVNGGTGAIKTEITGDLAGLQPLKDLLQLLVQAGVVIDSTTLGEAGGGGGGGSGLQVPEIPLISSQGDNPLCNASEAFSIALGLWVGWLIYAESQSPGSLYDFLVMINRDWDTNAFPEKSSLLNPSLYSRLDDLRAWFIIHEPALGALDGDGAFAYADAERTKNKIWNVLRPLEAFDEAALTDLRTFFSEETNPYGPLFYDAIDTLPLEYWQRWFYTGLQGSSSFCSPEWTVGILFAADDWAASVNLLLGSYSAGNGYGNGGGGVVEIEIPYHIYDATFVVPTGSSGVATVIEIEDIATSDVTGYAVDPLTTYAFWQGDATAGLRCRVNFGSSNLGFITISNLTGIGTEPVP